MVLGQPAGYIKLWSSLAKPWRRLWGELSYLGPQDYLPPNPKRTGPTISPGWDTSSWNPDATTADQDYTNAQAASDAGPTPVVRRPYWNVDGFHLIAVGNSHEDVKETYNANGYQLIASNMDLTSYVGQTIRVKFLVHQGGFGALTGMFVDDVQLTLPCGSISPTPPPRATPIPRPR